MPDVTQVHVSPWCSGVNCNSGRQGMFLPNRGQFSPISLPTPLARQDFQATEVPQKMGQDVSGPRTEKDCAKFRPKMETGLQVVRKEEEEEEEALIQDDTEREDDHNITNEIPTKKMKMVTTDKDHVMETEDIGQTSPLQKTTQLNDIKVKRANVSGREKKMCTPQTKIKQEFPEPQTVKTYKGELCIGNKTKMDVQDKLPHKATTKQHTKSKKGIKHGTVRPYNTRTATSRPRTYSSDFVMPEEEEEWKKEKEAYHMKGRQRSKLNRLLANEHERRRVAQLNSAYQDLRQLIPGYQCDTKLPKIKILKYAINYIAHLDDILERV